MTEGRARRKLSGIFSADAVGYSRLMEEDEASTIRNLEDSKRLMSKLIEQFKGRVVDAPGDNLLAEFGSVVDATECAVKIQQELKTKNAELPDNRKMEFRIGVNLGDVVEESDRIYGDGVNIAARIEGLAEPGGICISRTAFDHVKNKLQIGYEYLGEHSVKNIAEPVRIYRILMEPEAAGKVIGEKKPEIMKWRWAASGAITLTILVVGIIIFWNYFFRPSFEPASLEKMAFPLPDKPSIAVLPFANIIGDSKQDYICDGISEEIITALSKVPQLFVIARNSSFSYKGKPIKAKQIAEDLGVRYILEGAVRRSENRLRITAQLTDTIKGNHIWSERYERDMKDLFAVQDEVTLKILTELGVKLTLGEEARLWAKGTEDIEAYLKVLQGRYYINLQSKESNVIARQMAKEAIALDPDFPTAYTLLGNTHLLDVWLGLSKSSKESLEQAEELYRRAIALDDSCASAHSALCHVYVHRRLYEEAISEGERAVALNPSAAPAYGWLGTALRFAGRHEEAVSTYEKAMRLDPYPSAVLLQGLGNAYHMVGRYQEALTAFKRALRRDPDNMFVHLGLARIYSALDQEKEAQAAAAEVMRIDPKFSLYRYAKTLPYKNQMDKDRIISELRKAGFPEHPPLPLPDKPSIAVIPFVNMSDDPEQDYFSDGLSEEIITALSKVPGLFVIARYSSFTYKGKPVKIQQVSEELGVRYVLEGSVRKSGNQLRITTQLIDAINGRNLWAERYDRKLKDIFAIQDEITIKILSALRVKLKGGQWIPESGTDNLQAYMKTLEGTGYFYESKYSEAMKCFEEARTLDPQWANIYGWLANVHLMNVWFGPSEKKTQSLRKAFEFAQECKILDDKLEVCPRILGHVYLLKRDYDKAISEGKRAVEINPNSPTSLALLSLTLRSAGMYEEALGELEKARRLDPNDNRSTTYHLCATYNMMRRHEEAIAACKKVVEVYPKNLSAYIQLAIGYTSLERMDEARTAAFEIKKIDPNFSVEQFAKTLPYKKKPDIYLVVNSLLKAGLE